MKSNFKNVWVCQECETQFIDKPKEECPVCLEIQEIKNLINSMKTQEEYRKVKSRINKMEDSIPKFDLFNLTNVTRKEREIKG